MVCDPELQAAPAPTPDPWDGPEDGVYWPEPVSAPQRSPEVASLNAWAQQQFVKPATPSVDRVAEIKAQFKALDLDGVA
ncbi:hypothetical protein [uncultured Deinococcus sp.]|uniref:hypothetical protein n=1 Tax=uncultured Deinococcus sp. TaxID=158789 RepID=UPI00258C2213|nr:hypothetical protein [uncultured Deinococcus sp.]